MKVANREQQKKRLFICLNCEMLQTKTQSCELSKKSLVSIIPNREEECPTGKWEKIKNEEVYDL